MFNTSKIFEYGLSELEFVTLCQLKNGDFIHAEAKPESIELLKSKEYINEKLQLSKRGLYILKEITTLKDSGYDPGDFEDFYSNILKLYEQYGIPESKIAKTELVLKDRLSWFLKETGFRLEVVYKQIENFLNLYAYNNEKDEDWTFLKRLDYLIWDPPSKAFSHHPNLKDSILYDFICKQYKILDLKDVIDKGGKSYRWLFEISKLLDKIPRRGVNPEYYLTGSLKGDEDLLKGKRSLLYSLLKK